MRPVPLYLLKRISDDIERIDRKLESAERVRDPEDARLIRQVRGDLNEMRVYVNDAWEPMDLADAEAN